MGDLGRSVVHGTRETPSTGAAMTDTENIFDTSTNLMEIEEPPGGETDARPREAPVPGLGSEPDYFTPNPAVGHVDARRRALAVLGLVGGGIFMAILISAATGSGNDGTPSTLRRPAPGSGSEPGQTATIVGPGPAARSTTAHARVTAHPRLGPPPAKRSQAREQSSSAAAPRPRRHRRRHPHPTHSTAPAPPPEPTYAPEPETTYVPTEAEPPPPTTTPSPPPASSPPSGGQQEFGIEP